MPPKKGASSQRTKKVPLYLGTSIESLEQLVKKDESVKNIKNVRRLPPVLRKLKREIYNQVNDQEKCYLLSKRYIHMVERLLRLHEDPKYIDSMFSVDLDKIKKLLFDITLDLRERYLDQYDSEHSDHTMFGSGSSHASTVTDPGERIYIQPSAATTTTYTPISTPRSEDYEPLAVKVPDKIIFKDWLIKPVDLYNAIICQIDILIVDIRQSQDFAECRIIVTKGCVINIPAALIIPGDSANTLGKKIDLETQLIWQRRETFEAIILVDSNTTKYDYQTSKLAVLRNILIQWDINKIYKQEPVVLNGGLKEYIEWYPSQVTNKHAFLLHNCNVEIEELLDIESIVYPEPGSTNGPKNVKKFSIYSIGHLHHRIARDFGAASPEDDGLSASKSEGHLSVDMFESQDIAPGAFESTSEPFIKPHIEFTETVPDKTAEYPEVVLKKPRLMTEEGDIKDIIHGNMVNLLKEARAVKPKGDFMEFKDVFQGVQITGKDERKRPYEAVGKPAIDRSQKPTLMHARIYSCPGEGFTGLRNLKNICYMNALLQSIKVIPVMKSIYVTSNLYKVYTTRNPPVLNFDFAKVMQELWKGYKAKDLRDRRLYYIREFKAKIVQLNQTYDLGNHEDTFEFFTFLFTHISQDCEYDIQKPNVMTDSQRAWIGHLGGRSSFFIDLFFYQTKNSRVCRKCNKVNLSFEIESTLMLPLPENFCTLEGLIWEYLKESVISDYACTKCKTIGSLMHHKEIVVTPDVLVIVLKRYRVGRDGRITKNKVPVLFPTDDLKFGKSLYKLYAVPQHVGTTDVGHYYTTVLLNDTTDEWFTFNDDTYERVSPLMSENKDIGPNCVGFFYIKKTDCDNDETLQ